MAHRILVLTPAEAQARRAALAGLLVDAVQAGASVNFVWPMDRAKAAAWWDGALASHARGERLILTAELDGRLDGTVQLVPAAQPNQAHRADIAKMLVHTRARRQGLGAALLRAAETEALRLGRILLNLDTETASADGSRLDAASFFYKRLVP